MGNPVNFTLTVSKDGNTSAHKFAAVPYLDYWRMQGKLLELESEAHMWGLDTILGLPSAMGDDSAGNFRASLDADGGVPNWGKGIYENGIPQAAADLLAAGIDAAMAPLAAYRV